MKISKLQLFTAINPINKLGYTNASYKTNISFQSSDTFVKSPHQMSFDQICEMKRDAQNVYRLTQRAQQKFTDFQNSANQAYSEAQKTVDEVRQIIQSKTVRIMPTGDNIVNKYTDERQDGKLLRRTYFSQYNDSSNNINIHRIEEYNSDGTINIIELLPASLYRGDVISAVAKGVRIHGNLKKTPNPAKNYAIILYPSREKTKYSYSAQQEFYYGSDVIGKEFVQKNKNGTYKAKAEYEMPSVNKKVLNEDVLIPTLKSSGQLKISNKYKFEDYGQGLHTTATHGYTVYPDGGRSSKREFYFHNNNLEHFSRGEKISADLKFSVDKEWTNFYDN